jgi:hypothetical protein
MRKLLFSMLLLGSLLHAEDFVGWVSDSSCGAANASADKGARECAKACLKGGASAVLVTDKDQKVYKLANAAKAATFVEKKVKVSGKVKGDTIEVTSIAYAE